MCILSKIQLKFRARVKLPLAELCILYPSLGSSPGCCVATLLPAVALGEAVEEPWILGPLPHPWKESLAPAFSQFNGVGLPCGEWINRWRKDLFPSLTLFKYTKYILKKIYRKVAKVQGLGQQQVCWVRVPPLKASWFCLKSCLNIVIIPLLFFTTYMVIHCCEISKHYLCKTKAACI